MNGLTKFLKDFRKKKAWTQVDMAEKLGISLSWYKAIETGASVGVMTIREIARVTKSSIKKINNLIEQGEE